MSDGTAPPVTATVAITVTPVNDPPTANPASVSAVSGQATSIALSGADIDGDALSFVIVTAPVQGTLTGTGPGFSYTSAAGFSGTDSLTFAVSDGIVQSAPVTVPIAVSPQAATAALLVASNSSRTFNVRSLDGSTLSGGSSAYIFVRPGPAISVRRVVFTLDGRPFSIEPAAPYDFAGTTRGGAAYPFESNLLSLGSHVITATVVQRNGSTSVVTATFNVANTTSHSLVVSSSPDRRDPVPLSGAVLAGRRYIFLGPASDRIAGATSVVFRLDGRVVTNDVSVPHDLMGSTRNGSAVALDTRRLRNGFHRVSAVVQLAGGATFTYDVQFRVSN